MKNRTLFYLLFFQLIALILLFPYTPKGEAFMEKYFLPGNLREEELLPPPTPAPVPAPAPTPTPIPLTAFYTEIGGELPGYYDLVSMRLQPGWRHFNSCLVSRARGRLSEPTGASRRPDLSGRPVFRGVSR